MVTYQAPSGYVVELQEIVVRAIGFGRADEFRAFETAEDVCGFDEDQFRCEKRPRAASSSRCRMPASRAFCKRGRRIANIQ